MDMSHPVSSESVANFFLQKSFDTGIAITPMKLIKLVYIAHGWHLGYLDQALINDAVEAWQYGPVIPDLYHKVKAYGRRTITAPVDNNGVIGDEQNPPPNENSLALLERIWEVYGKHDGVQLSALTHQPKTPWDITWQAGGKDHYAGFLISNETIKEHYKRKISA